MIYKTQDHFTLGIENISNQTKNLISQFINESFEQHLFWFLNDY